MLGPICLILYINLCRLCRYVQITVNENSLPLMASSVRISLRYRYLKAKALIPVKSEALSQKTLNALNESGTAFIKSIDPINSAVTHLELYEKLYKFSILSLNKIYQIG